MSPVSCLLSLVLAASAKIKVGAPSPNDGDLDFLRAHQPAAHQGKVGEEYLRENVKLAREARETAPWKAILTEETFREDVLPYTVIDEEVDRWRPLFRGKFWPLVKGCKADDSAGGRVPSLRHSRAAHGLQLDADSRQPFLARILRRCRVALVARGADGRRVSVPFRVLVSGSGKVVYEGRTYDETHDMNDHVIVEQPLKTKVIVQLKSADGSWRNHELVEYTDAEKEIMLAETRAWRRW